MQHRNPKQVKIKLVPRVFPLLPFSKEKTQAGDDKWTRFGRNDNYFPKTKTTVNLKQKYLSWIRFRQYIMGTFFPSFFHGLLVRGSTASRQTTKTLTVNRQKSQFFYRRASEMQLNIVFLFATPKVAYNDNCDDLPSYNSKLSVKKFPGILNFAISADLHALMAPEESPNWKSQFPCFQKHSL